MARNPFSSSQNEILIPILSNRGTFTVNAWSQNLILIPRILRNGCLGNFGPGNAQKSSFYYFSGQNQIMRPLFNITCTPITRTRSVLRISFQPLKNQISSHIVFHRPKNGKNQPFMVIFLMKMFQRTQNHIILLLWKW